MPHFLTQVNEAIRRDSAAFAAECDAAFTATVAAAAERIADHRGESRVVLLSGPSASGKTTTALKIKEQMKRLGVETHTVSMDNYFNTIDPEQNIKPDLITVAFGTNDWAGRPTAEEFDTRAENFFSRLNEVYPGVPVYAILPLWRGDSWRQKPTGTFTEARARLAAIMAAHGCIIVDGMKAVPHLPEFFDDYRLHPNDLGFSFYAQEMIRVILENQKK